MPSPRNLFGTKWTKSHLSSSARGALGSTTLNEWGRDPTVKYGIIPQKKSVFDSVEDTDSDYCLSLLAMLKQQVAK